MLLLRKLYSMLSGNLNGKETQKKRKGGVYVYINNWFTSLYSRNKYKIVKQLYSNKIN